MHGNRHSDKVILRGEPVSDRVAFGYAHYVSETIDFNQIHRIHITDPGSEIKRLEGAFETAAGQIKQVAEHARGISDQDKAIIEAHLMFLSDKSLEKKNHCKNK